jgi:hypothetical protein
MHRREIEDEAEAFDTGADDDLIPVVDSVTTG